MKFSCRFSPQLAMVFGFVGLIAFVAKPVTAQGVAGVWGPMTQWVPHHDRIDRLGVAVTDSPGVGVLVQSVAAGSPADQVGIRLGDYILSSSGVPVDDPASLVEAIEQQDATTKMSVGIWRDGKEQTLQVMLAAATGQFGAKRAWLGVTLQANGNVGAKIAQVIPGSPAAQAGLAIGDLIVAVNEQSIESASELVEAIERLSAGESVKLTLRGDPDRQVDVKLGSMSTAPPLFSRRVPVPDFEDLPEFRPWPAPARPHPNWRDAFSSLERELNELREELRTLRNPAEELKADDPDDGGDFGAPETDDGSRLDRLPENGVDSVLGSPPYQLVDQRYDRNRRTYRYSYGYPSPYYRYGVYRYPFRSYDYRGPRYYPSYPRPYYRSYDRPYYRAGVQVYVGPYGFQYYYR